MVGKHQFYTSTKSPRSGSNVTDILFTEMSHPDSYKAYAFTEKDGDLKPITVPWKDPEPGEVVVKVLACGVCAGDEIVKHQLFPVPTGYPRIPGHEIIGEVVAVPPGESYFKVGDRIGSGWHGGHCTVCSDCRSGKYILCGMQKGYINGIYKDGGYAEYATLNTHSLLHVSKELGPAEAAPLLCAGVTMFNSLRHMSISPGEIVAIQGIGGLGHLGIQYANKMGYNVVAISTSPSKKDLSLELGASVYIDSSQTDPATELQKLGGAKVIMSCAPSVEAMSSVIGGLANDGTLLLLAPTAEPLPIPTTEFVNRRLSLRGFPAGSPHDSDEAIRFAQLKGIKTMVQTFTLDQAQEAFDHRSNARFRAVILP
ncbi:GroES-like protein [Panus rudis PR-1116 ss-1]|nr:GroES-like protein [Panus rudis PR-1116 ss-1]